MTTPNHTPGGTPQTTGDATEGAKQPAGTAANTSGGATAVGSHNPRQIDQDQPQGVPGTSSDATARPLGGSSRFGGGGSAPGNQGEFNEQQAAQARAEKRQSHMQGLVVAHDNAVKEMDALISQVSQGNAVTGTQLTRLKSMMQGLHATAKGMAEGTMEPFGEAQSGANQPGSAGTQAQPGAGSQTS